MMKIWKAVSEVGIKYGETKEQRRLIVICNRVSAIIFLSAIVINIVAVSYFGIIKPIILSQFSTALLLSPILFNHFGYLTLSRFTMIFMLTIASTVLSVMDKQDHVGGIEDFEYFQYRVILLTSAIYPFILFSIREKNKLIFALGFAYLNLILQDPIHDFFGVGYYQVGFTSPSYNFVNYMVSFAFFILAGGTYFLKAGFEKSEQENEKLIDQLTRQQDHLEKANEQIRSQQEELSRENLQLNRELIEKNNQLSQTNQELIRHNNELQQFSYSVSHNLRGPVASLKGIINLIDTSQIGKSNSQLVGHLESSVTSLDNTIKDLNHIIDVRNEISRVRQKLLLLEEMDHIRALLHREVVEHNVQFDFDFDPKFEIYSVKSMLSSILYNLVSNGIKYRSPDRQARIAVKAFYNQREVKLEVVDNGLGMDVDRYRDKLFGLYKRFHTHTEGRGLGLFLVKLQVETLGGRIEIKSATNIGTTFSVYLPTPPNVEHQILLDTPAATLYFDAAHNCLGVNWKRDVGSEEFEVFINKAIEFIKVYRTPNWLSNIVDAAGRDEEELNKVRRQRNGELIKAGLKRIAVVMPSKNYESQEYEYRKNVILKAYDIEFEFFDSVEDALKWLESKNSADRSASISRIMS